MSYHVGFIPDGDGGGFFIYLDPDLQKLQIGPIVHSRWLTLACRILRIYTSTKQPSKSLVQLTNFCLKISFPTWFNIKKENKITDGAKNILKLIGRVRQFPADKVRDISMKVLQQNAYFLHLQLWKFFTECRTTSPNREMPATLFRPRTQNVPARIGKANLAGYTHRKAAVQRPGDISDRRTIRDRWKPWDIWILKAAEHAAISTSAGAWKRMNFTFSNNTQLMQFVQENSQIKKICTISENNYLKLYFHTFFWNAICPKAKWWGATPLCKQPMKFCAPILRTTQT